MNFKDTDEIIALMDMDEQQLVLIALFNSLGAERIYEILAGTVDFLRMNNRESVAGILEKAAGNMFA
ncbi:MAG: hypothetical protein VR69_12600 [Peptococcaceae bacterium BRH_c4b]|nr:MAG: hypothetical protein VR69_12600 [Peptococcaceae bacterium BRH_c4b]